jgi:hypothetical protein
LLAERVASNPSSLKDERRLIPEKCLKDLARVLLRALETYGEELTPDGGVRPTAKRR